MELKSLRRSFIENYFFKLLKYGFRREAFVR